MSAFLRRSRATGKETQASRFIPLTRLSIILIRYIGAGEEARSTTENSLGIYFIYSPRRRKLRWLCNKIHNEIPIQRVQSFGGGRVSLQLSRRRRRLRWNGTIAKDNAERKVLFPIRQKVNECQWNRILNGTTLFRMKMIFFIRRALANLTRPQVADPISLVKLLLYL